MKKNIALVTGGFSGEAVISYKSAVTIENNLDRDLFNVYKIDITEKGWNYESSGNSVTVDKNDFSLTLEGKPIKFDAVFIGMHGTPGEDGKLQGYFDTLMIPYTGCDAGTSAITFNKRFAVGVAAQGGIAVARSVIVFKDSYIGPDDIISSIKFPVFVKPNNGGSSIGMSKVSDKSGIEKAIQKAFNEDEQVLVEEMITGREFTVGVFKTKKEIIVLPLTEVKADEGQEFFDFVAKYQGKSTETTPAVVDDEIANKIREAARKVYSVFNCRGVVRIDFIYNEESGRPFMLEVNTIPGQSEASIVPQQVKAMGWSLKKFYTKLIEECF